MSDESAGIALEAKAIGDVNLDTDGHRDPDGEDAVMIRFGEKKGLATGKIIMSPEQAVALARDLDEEVRCLDHKRNRPMIEAADAAEVEEPAE